MSGCCKLNSSSLRIFYCSTSMTMSTPRSQNLRITHSHSYARSLQAGRHSCIVSSYLNLFGALAFPQGSSLKTLPGSSHQQNVSTYNLRNPSMLSSTLPAITTSSHRADTSRFTTKVFKWGPECSGLSKFCGNWQWFPSCGFITRWEHQCLMLPACEFKPSISTASWGA